MANVDLHKKQCKPCEGGIPALSDSDAQSLVRQIPGWSLDKGKISRTYTFKNFVEAVSFINRIAGVAEGEGHHPDLQLFKFKNVKVDLWTHAVGGLTENDFIVAAKIDKSDCAGQ